MKVIKTSSHQWLRELALAYKNNTRVLFEDDAGLGVDLSEHTLFDMGKKAKLSMREFAGVCVSVGISLAGVSIIILAYLDPEPTTKLSLLVVSGITLSLTGGFSAIYTLTELRPPSIKITPNGVEIDWQK